MYLILGYWGCVVGLGFKSALGWVLASVDALFDDVGAGDF